MTRRELVIAGLQGGATPRRPVVCPGGMMSFAVAEAMEATGCRWPEAHHDPAQMARLATTTARIADFDNVGLPFCMTVEAEAMGATVSPGSADIHPHVIAEPLTDAASVASYTPPPAPATDRRRVVIEAVRQARDLAPDLAIVASVVGPLSLAAQLLDASLLLRAMHRDPGSVHSLTRLALAAVKPFAIALAEAGADAVMIADPTACGELLGQSRFREFALPYLQDLTDAVHDAGAPVIVHICGDVGPLLPALGELHAEAVSVDHVSNIRAVRAALPDHRLMGNISGWLLEDGPTEAIASNCQAVLRAGVDILAPSCGVVPGTPARHLQAMAAQVQRDEP